MKITNETKLEMIKYLRGLASGKIKPRILAIGLCNNFHFKFNVNIMALVKFKNFPEYSGDEVYPIKSPNKEIIALDYYELVENAWIGRYGNSRKRFCAWCADEIERTL